ncbi:MAG: (2Fe-2S)-binding protein, partial [Rubrivivax sp.]
VLPARSAAGVAPAQAFVAMHWGPEFVSGGINQLTTGAFCPQSKQPELKHTAVRLEPAALPWRLLAAAWLPEADLAATRDALRALMPEFGFFSLVPFGQQHEGLLLRAAAEQAPAPEWLDRIETLLGLAREDRRLLRYADPTRGRRRTLRLQAVDGGSARLQAFVLAGDVSEAGATEWVRSLLQDGAAVEGLSRQLLSPTGQVQAAPRRRQVCNCFDVDESAINTTLSQGSGSPEQRLAALQGKLRCGTQCGSCLPELRRLVRAATAAA